MHKISQSHIVLAYGKPFITKLFEGPSYYNVRMCKFYRDFTRQFTVRFCMPNRIDIDFRMCSLSFLD